MNENIPRASSVYYYRVRRCRLYYYSSCSYYCRLFYYGFSRCPGTRVAAAVSVAPARNGFRRNRHWVFLRFRAGCGSRRTPPHLPAFFPPVRRGEPSKPGDGARHVPRDNSATAAGFRENATAVAPPVVDSDVFRRYPMIYIGHGVKSPILSRTIKRQTIHRCV